MRRRTTQEIRAAIAAERREVADMLGHDVIHGLDITVALNHGRDRFVVAPA